jgi:hypothetical protein
LVSFAWWLLALPLMGMRCRGCCSVVPVSADGKKGGGGRQWRLKQQQQQQRVCVSILALYCVSATVFSSLSHPLSRSVARRSMGNSEEDGFLTDGFDFVTIAVRLALSTCLCHLHRFLLGNISTSRLANMCNSREVATKSLNTEIHL